MKSNIIKSNVQKYLFFLHPLVHLKTLRVDFLNINFIYSSLRAQYLKHRQKYLYYGLNDTIITDLFQFTEL